MLPGHLKYHVFKINRRWVILGLWLILRFKNIIIALKYDEIIPISAFLIVFVYLLFL